MNSYSNDAAILKLLDCFPAKIADWIKKYDLNQILEVLLDYGRNPELHFYDDFVTLDDYIVTAEDIEFILGNMGSINSDNRCGLEGTLHRISCIRDRESTVVGLTCRVGRVFVGSNKLIEDLIDSGESVLILGRPGVGKTSRLREACFHLANNKRKRVVIVDASNEIAGEGIVPHIAVGRSRRMQVPPSKKQYQVMIEAVENATPRCIVVDEISTLDEALAARTIAERGVQLLGTAHGDTLINVLNNDPLYPILGRIKGHTVSDDTAKKKNGGQKGKQERVANPTFTKIVELITFNRVAIHHDSARSVDILLSGGEVYPEIRELDDNGNVIVVQELSYVEFEDEPDTKAIESPIRIKKRK